MDILLVSSCFDGREGCSLGLYWKFHWCIDFVIWVCLLYSGHCFDVEEMEGQLVVHLPGTDPEEPVKLTEEEEEEASWVFRFLV